MKSKEMLPVFILNKILEELVIARATNEILLKNICKKLEIDSKLLENECNTNIEKLLSIKHEYMQQEKKRILDYMEKHEKPILTKI